MSCPLFGRCGGCRYDGSDYSAELALKEEQLRRLFLPVLGEAFFSSGKYEGILGSPTSSAYRNKMEFSFGNAEKDGPLTLGLHQKKSFFNVLSVSQCGIVHEDMNRICRETEAFFAERGTPFYHKKSHSGFLRHLVLRRSETSGELLINLVTASGLKEQVLRDWCEALMSAKLEGRIAGILHTENDALSDAIIAEKTRILFGEAKLTETLLGLKFTISPFSFFQTNTRGAELLYEKAREYIAVREGSVVYDLYSGTGTIAQILAPAAARVYGVEIVAEAVEAARENAKINGLTNCSFIAGDVLHELENFPEKADFIVLDPPRDGINPKAVSKLLRVNAERIIYISCKPSSLARDIPAFALGGCRAERLCFIDMFPRTDNCEAICLLSRT